MRRRPVRTQVPLLDTTSGDHREVLDPPLPFRPAGSHGSNTGGRLRHHRVDGRCPRDRCCRTTGATRVSARTAKRSVPRIAVRSARRPRLRRCRIGPAITPQKTPRTNMLRARRWFRRAIANPMQVNVAATAKSSQITRQIQPPSPPVPAGTSPVRDRNDHEPLAGPTPPAVTRSSPGSDQQADTAAPPNTGCRQVGGHSS